MPEDYESKQAVCPFYKRMATRQAVVCEGDSPATNSVKQFRNVGECRRYRERYCNSHDYVHCPHAILLDVQYEEDD